MSDKPLPNQVRLNKNGQIDQRTQQITPVEKSRIDPNEAAKRTQKQAGQDLRDPANATKTPRQH